MASSAVFVNLCIDANALRDVPDVLVSCPRRRLRTSSRDHAFPPGEFKDFQSFWGFCRYLTCVQPFSIYYSWRDMQKHKLYT